MISVANGPDLSYDEQTQLYRFRYTGNGSFAVELVLAVAAVLDEDPTDLDPLYDHVDTDVLEELTTGEGSFTGDVMLDYSGVRIRIAADGCVVIRSDTAPGPATDPFG